MVACARCESSPEVGVLCGACSVLLAPVDGLMPDHVTSVATPAAEAWLVDGFGTAHPVVARTRIGRRVGSQVVVLHGSVSRDHAEILRTSDGWQVRDLGSRNATHLDGRRVEGRATLDDLAVVRIGDVAFLFVARKAAFDPAGAAAAQATTFAARSGPFRVILRSADRELCVLGSLDDAAGGALLHRSSAGATWNELSLSALEYHLLRALCARALDDPDGPQRTRGAVLTKTLIRALPFQTRFANEENVRQAVRRLRTTLDEIGATDVIVTVPGRGYYIAWAVALG
jgi:hypothetical protein